MLEWVGDKWSGVGDSTGGRKVSLWEGGRGRLCRLCQNLRPSGWDKQKFKSDKSFFDSTCPWIAT